MERRLISLPSLSLSSSLLLIPLSYSFPGPFPCLFLALYRSLSSNPPPPSPLLALTSADDAVVVDINFDDEEEEEKKEDEGGDEERRLRVDTSMSLTSSVHFFKISATVG